MKQVIPFSKNIEFDNMINSITNISLEHNLNIKDYDIVGEFLISGKYKTNITSLEEDFSYNIPVDISIDQKYKTDNINLEIEDFKYVSDNNVLKIDIDLGINNLEKKEEIEILDTDNRKILTSSEKENIEEIINSDNTINLFKEEDKKEKLEITKDSDNNTANSLFSAFKDTEETFTTYSIYIIRDGDNIEDIIAKYKTTREILGEYNDMSNIKKGTKLIIPSVKDEDNK